MKRIIVVTAVVFLFLIGVAQADLIFTGSSGDLAAEAIFGISGSHLLVTLTNTSSADVADSAGLLTALFFTIKNDPLLAPISAFLNSGSTVLYDLNGPVTNNVGGEWAYANNLSAPNGADEGIGSAGFALFGQANFLGPDLEPPTAVDGAQYGILSAAFDPNNTTANAGVTDSGGQIQNSVVFELSGLPDGFKLTDISNVSFQYGTALTEPNVPGVPGDNGGGGGGSVPEPGTVVLLGSGLLGLGLYGRLRSRK